MTQTFAFVLSPLALYGAFRFLVVRWRRTDFILVPAVIAACWVFVAPSADQRMWVRFAATCGWLTFGLLDVALMKWLKKVKTR